jgi:hypothetical protein
VTLTLCIHQDEDPEHMHKEEGKSNVDKKGGCTMLNLILLVLSNQEVVAATQ